MKYFFVKSGEQANWWFWTSKEDCYNAQQEVSLEFKIANYSCSYFMGYWEKGGGGGGGMR